ncbi:MAG: hypothetical protein ACWGQW_20720, partial [bacterium]
PVFHQWIQQQAISDHLLVDVHDYSHVPQGPGILLYGHEGSFSLDLAENRAGLLYQRTRPSCDSLERELSSVFRTLLKGCNLLQSQRLAGRSIQFKTDELKVVLHDRLNAPNTAETFGSLEPVLSEFLQHILQGSSFTLSHQSDPREQFSVHINVDSSPGFPELMARADDDIIH